MAIALAQQTAGAAQLAADCAAALRERDRGRGAFRRFADTLRRGREDELSRWFEFTDERKRGRARAWLADVGYGAVGH
ncbi:hypothetical protein ACQP04_35425 [Pseudonocardia halophobica]|uniref:hypothetical protein n=1 Tax=Pseudonocardia halophobica TaxID=29401 RepID=UPI003D8AF8C2